MTSRRENGLRLAINDCPVLAFAPDGRGWYVIVAQFEQEYVVASVKSLESTTWDHGHYVTDERKAFRDFAERVAAAHVETGTTA